MAAEKGNNIALLVDGDNVFSKVMVGLMAEIANYGTASVRRIYADRTSPQLRGWKDCLLAHSIQPMQQFAYTNHKNATDGAMIIDAMDLLYTGSFSSFCMVSSDSDFTRLAVRIRERGVTVYGFGERKTSSAFIAACNRVVYFDVLDVPTDDESTETKALAASTSSALHAHPNRALSARDASAPPAPSRLRPPHLQPSTRPQPRPIDHAAIDGLSKAINNCVGWRTLVLI